MEGEAPSLDYLIERIAFFGRDPVDFTSLDPAVTLWTVRFLTYTAIYFNVLVVADFGGRAGGMRGQHLVEQVVAAAFQTFAGTDPHPDPFSKAAMLLRGITQGHPFSDGNKRTGFLLAAYFLTQVGTLPPAHSFDRAAVVDFCMAVSAGQIRDVDEMARRLRDLWH